MALLFLRLGLTAFGGPAAHVALMEDQAVRRRRWVSREAFLDLLGACNLLPGPGSTQLAMGLGYRRAGWAGLAVGGLCFILPAALLTLALAWAYVRFGLRPQARGLLYGLKPMVLAVVGQAAWSLSRTALRGARWLLAGAVLVGAWAGLPPLALLLGAGVWALGVDLARRRGTAGLWPACLSAAPGIPSLGAGSLFLFFLKAGALVFGSGYVLLAFLQADLVDRWHWLSQAQLLDAVAAGQVTPGPVFTTATFIGYLLGGWKGAALATLGIFLPSFLFLGLLGRILPEARRSPAAGAFLDGVNAGAVALLAAVAWTLGRAALVDGWTLAFAASGLAVLLRFRPNPAWVLLGGGLAGWLIRP